MLTIKHVSSPHNERVFKDSPVTKTLNILIFLPRIQHLDPVLYCIHGLFLQTYFKVHKSEFNKTNLRDTAQTPIHRTRDAGLKLDWNLNRKMSGQLGSGGNGHIAGTYICVADQCSLDPNIWSFLSNENSKHFTFEVFNHVYDRV